MSFRYDDDDDSWPSSDDSTNTSFDVSSTSISDPQDDEPEWMRKFEVAKSVKSHSVAGTEVSISEITKSQSSQPTEWLQKFERAKDEQSSTNTPLPTNDNNNESDWTQEIERANDDQSSINSPFSSLDNGEDRDWLKKFETAKNIGTSTQDNDTGENDGGDMEPTKSRDPPADPLPKPASETLQNSVGGANGTNRASPISKRYRKLAPTDKMSRRERIRRNLEKLRRRERIRKNLETIKMQRKKGKDAKKEKREKKKQRENEIPTMSGRMRKYERAIFKGMEKKVQSRAKGNQGAPTNSRDANQLAEKTTVAPQIENKKSWSIDKETNKLKYKGKKWISPLTNGIIGEKSERTPAQKSLDTKKQQTHEFKKQYVANVGKYAPPQSPYQKELTQVPSIKSKVNALRQVINKNDGKTGAPRPPVPRPGNQHANPKAHRKKAPVEQHTPEIESSVPENLFSMWGDTIKATTPKPDDSSLYSDKMLKRRAKRLKERIEQAKIDASFGTNRTPIGDSSTAGSIFGTSTINSKISSRDSLGDIDSESSEDAAALFHSARTKGSDWEEYTYDNMDHNTEGYVWETSVDRDLTATIRLSDGGDVTDEDDAFTDDDAEALFHAAGSSHGSAKETGDDQFTDDDAEALFHAAGSFHGSAKDTGEDEFTDDDAEALFHAAGSSHDSAKETGEDQFTDDDAEALFHAAGSFHGSAKETGESDAIELDYDTEEFFEEVSMDETMDDQIDATNGSNRVDSQIDELDEETSGNMDESEMDETLDDYDAIVPGSVKRDELDEKASVIDESEMADTMDEYPSPAKKSDRDLDATMNSEIFSPAPTKKKQYSVPLSNEKTTRSFDEDGSFFASDFSDASFEADEKKAKKSKKTKPQKKKSKKNLKTSKKKGKKDKKK